MSYDIDEIVEYKNYIKKNKVFSNKSKIKTILYTKT